MYRSALLRSLLLLALAGVALVAFFLLPDLRKHLKDFVEWLRSLGPWGPVAVALIYVPATVLFIPGTLISLAAGYVFGIVVGTIAVSIGSTAGASAAFWVGRTVGRRWVEKRIADSPRFRALDQAVAEQGFKIVLLTRLSPVFPFNLLNYVYGLTRVRFRDYLLASWIGMLPGTILYISLGASVKDVSDLLSGNVEEHVAAKMLKVVGLMATVVVTLYVTHLARKALRQAVPALETAKKADAAGVPHA